MGPPIVRVSICIKGSETHRERFKGQQETWIEDSLPVEYLTGPMLGVPDDYLHLPEKTQAICKKFQDYDFIFLCDTDTYVSMPRLLASGFEHWDYTGYVLDTLPVPPYCSGPHYWLSKKALEILAGEDWSRYTAAGYETCEDVMVGGILFAHGIEPHHDPRYALFESPTPENEVIANHLSSREAYRLEMMYAAERKMRGETPLCKLAAKWHSDKCFFYTPYYHRLLGGRRREIKKVLEIGIGSESSMGPSIARCGWTSYPLGASLYMWRDYFPEAHITGLDNDRETLFSDFGIETFYCEQAKIETYPETVLGSFYDLIIEDGSHEREDQLRARRILLPELAPGGIYVTEDISEPETWPYPIVSFGNGLGQAHLSVYQNDC